MIVIDKVRPKFNNIIVTKEFNKEDVIKHGVIREAKGSLKEYQKVIAVGPAVRDLKEGAIIKLNLDRYAVKKYKPGSIKESMEQHMEESTSYNVPNITLNDVDFLLITDQDYDYEVLESHEVPNETLIVNKTKLIV